MMQLVMVKADLYYVSLYRVQQAYGGPEEGGWYYDDRAFLKAVLGPVGKKEADEFADRLRESLKETNKELKDESNRRVANMPDGPDPYLDTEGYIPTGFCVDEKLEVHVEQTKGMSETSGRPLYE